MNKSIILFLFLSSLFLVGCSSEENKNIVTEEKEIVLNESEGVFLGLFGDNYLEIETSEGKRLVHYKPFIEEQISEIKINSIISFSYEVNDNGLFTLHSIKSKEKKSDNKKEERPTNEDKNNDFIDVSTIHMFKLGLDFDLSNYIYHENRGNTDVLNHIDYPESYIKFEEVQHEREIKYERWHAAGILQEIGDLKEIENSSFIPGTTFLFFSENDETELYIGTIEDDEIRIRITVGISKDENVKPAFQSLLNSISLP